MPLNLSGSKQKEDAQAYIRQREKLASQRGGSNVGAVREAGRALIPQEEARIAAQNKQPTPEQIAAANKLSNPPVINQPTPEELKQAGQMSMQIPSILNPELMPMNIFRRPELQPAVSAGAGEALIAGGIAAPAAILGAGPTAGVSLAAIPLAAVGGFFRGFTNKLKEEQKENLRAEFTNLGTSSSYLQKLVRYVNTGGDTNLALQGFQNQLNTIDEAYSNIKLESMKPNNKFLNVDMRVELEQFENFYKVGGGREILTLQMQKAILKPDPNNQFTLEDLQ